MTWVVDTSVLIDVLENDPRFGPSSAALLDRLLGEGLEVSPLTYVELAPAFDGDRSSQEEFLLGVGIVLPTEWSMSDTMAAHLAWDRFIRSRRAGAVARRPIADILIGAFAAGRTGLITRNPADFATAFPDLRLAVPG